MQPIDCLDCLPVLQERRGEHATVVRNARVAQAGWQMAERSFPSINRLNRDSIDLLGR